MSGNRKIIPSENLLKIDSLDPIERKSEEQDLFTETLISQAIIAFSLVVSFLESNSHDSINPYILYNFIVGTELILKGNFLQQANDLTTFEAQKAKLKEYGHDLRIFYNQINKDCLDNKTKFFLVSFEEMFRTLGYWDVIYQYPNLRYGLCIRFNNLFFRDKKNIVAEVKTLAKLFF